MNTGLLLYLPYRALEQRVMAELADAGFADVTLAQARVFQRIGPGGSRLTDLAEQAQVTKQSAGFIVDRLEERGYVERVPDPHDGRARLVRVAARGTAAVAASQRTIDAIEAEWAEHLGAEAYAALRDALDRLREITDPFA